MRLCHTLRAGAALVATAAQAASHCLASLQQFDTAVAETVALDVSPLDARSPIVDPSTRVLVGVKSAALTGFEGRQLIRETWGNSATRSHNVSVVFLACEPNSSVPSLLRALDDEKRTYGDLLTHELACTDSYWTLVDKVLGFFVWTNRLFSALEYVVIADDDVFVDLHGFTSLLFQDIVPRERFYGGEVIQTQFGTTIRPLRDPNERNYLSVASYPLSEKPLFATGAHYVLSFDLVQFLARNRRSLRGVGTLEDVSVAWWLHSLLGVRPVYLPPFDNVRYTFCHNALLAYADLSPVAIRRMHDNQRQHRPLCDGFSFPAWDKRLLNRTIDLPVPRATGSGRRDRMLHHHWDAYVNETSSVLFLLTTIAADDTLENASAVYTPAKDSFAAFCMALLAETARAMPTTAIPRTFCWEHRSFVSDFLSSVVAATPALRSFYALAQHNLQQDGDSAAVFVALVLEAQTIRTLVECLVATVFEGAHVAVLDAAEHAERFRPLVPDVIVSHRLDSETRERDRFVRTRKLVFRELKEALNDTSTLDENDRVIFVTPILNDPQCRHQQCLYLPIASRSFAHRRKHSPVALLTPASASHAHRNDTVLVPCRHRRVVASAVVDVLTRALQDENLTMHYDDCRNDSATLDTEVERFAAFPFVLVVDDRVHVPGHVSDQLVSAFLVGAIPVYYGHSPTSSWLFNPRAFIDCGSFRSLRACARHVRAIAASSARSAAMRREPPIVNATAFVDVFSWHPHAIQTTPSGLGHRLIGQRLRTLVNTT